MAIPGSSLRMPVKAPKVAVFVDSSGFTIGTGFVGKMRGENVLLTAYHVYTALLDSHEPRITAADGTSSVAFGKRKVVYESQVLDHVGFEISNNEMSRLGLCSYQLTYPNSGMVQVCTPLQNSVAVATGEIRSTGSLRVAYSASTEPGSSGSPLLQGGRAVGIHSGGDPRGGMNVGHAFPLFAINKAEVLRESPVSYGLVSFAADVDPRAEKARIMFLEEEMSFMVNPDRTIFPSSWADEMDEIDARVKARMEGFQPENFPGPDSEGSAGPGSSAPSTPQDQILELERVLRSLQSQIDSLRGPRSNPPGTGKRKKRVAQVNPESKPAPSSEGSQL